MVRRYEVPIDFGIPVVAIEALYNEPSSGALGGPGLGMPEVSCFSLDQLSQLKVGTVYAQFYYTYENVTANVRYFTVCDGMLFNYVRRINDPMLKVVEKVNPTDRFGLEVEYVTDRSVVFKVNRKDKELTKEASNYEIR